MSALDETEGIVTALAHANDRHLEAGGQAFEAFIPNRDDDRRPGTFEQRAEDAFECGFVAIIVGVIPIEVHGHGDIRRERADGAVALVDLGHDPGRRSGGARRREGWIAEEPAEHVTEIGFRAGEGGDEQAARGRLAVAAADGNEAAPRDDFGE